MIVLFCYSNCLMHRSNTLWDNIMLSIFTDQDWLNNFRISRQTFLYLHPYVHDKLFSRLQRQNTIIRCCISVQKHVAIMLWCLATPAKCQTVGHIFRVSQSSVYEIAHETCSAIVSVLLKIYTHQVNPCTSSFLLVITLIML